MPEMVLLILFGALARLAAARFRRLHMQPQPAPLCAGCSFAHIQHGANGRRAISCSYGGDVRPVAIDVLYCTDYRNRNAPVLVKTVGFALPIDEEELLAEVAIADDEMPAA